MEEELRCFACKEFYREPVLLPCSHALCRVCARNLQTTLNDGENACGGSVDYQEADKASVSSETDSGVVCASRPNSYAGTPAVVTPPACMSITCPLCNKLAYLDENGAENLPPFRVMRTIVEKFGGKTLPVPVEEACQMCEGERRAAVVRCEQCSVRYCTACRDAWHPIRGPLAQHQLRPLGTLCLDHAAPPSHYCNICRTSVCQQCLSETHINHETQVISSAAKIQKTELSQSLHHLSEKAKALTEYIQMVKSTGEKANESCIELEAAIEAACAGVVRAVEVRREELVRAARGERARAAADARATAGHAATRLRAATALLHFSIEALKEPDSAAFLQVGSALSVRAQETSALLSAALDSPATPPALTLHTEAVLRAVKLMNFVECVPPEAPEMAVEACSARGTTARLAWRAPSPPTPGAVSGYVLELDDGQGGPFREVYCGRETVCTVEGLHYASLYSARVKAFNGAGDSPYSEVIGLQTSSVAWFTWDARCVGGGVGSVEGLRLEGGGLSAAAAGWEHRVALADTPLARGTHYWRLRIDRYCDDADPAFGVARADVARDKMLGSDALGWAMYIDGSRSWFVHGGAHGGRAAGGVRAGCTVGVLLDLTRATLSFTVDDRLQGEIAFTGMRGVFYPAISLNRGVAVTLQPGLTPPPELLMPQLSIQD